MFPSIRGNLLTSLLAVPLAACILQQLSAARGAQVQAFDRTFKLLGITFAVSCPNNNSLPALKIVPAGLEIDNAPITREVDGVVVGAEVADLNADRSPEIYVYIQSVGSGSYGSLVAYSANRRKSLSEIYLPQITNNAEEAKGYRGHDQFAVSGRALVRRFPVYREGDTNANPTGGMRQIQYTLVPGEAGWILRLEKIISEPHPPKITASGMM